MSAIGAYHVLNRTDFDACMKAARTKTFKAAWEAAVSKTVDFDGSGYLLGQYLDAQREVNERELFDEQSEVGRTLAEVFTAAFVFDQPLEPPELLPDRLEEYCRDEYGQDGPQMADALLATHAFYKQGLSEISPENLVVFVIR
jgi:hypothetical protein